jgi:hypothetical protein
MLQAEQSAEEYAFRAAARRRRSDLRRRALYPDPPLVVGGGWWLWCLWLYDCVWVLCI